MAQTMREIQDWEFAEEKASGEWETVDIQIENEAEALKQAQDWANKHHCRCAVSTSIRFEVNGSVEDRGIVPGNPEPIIIEPQ